MSVNLDLNSSSINIIQPFSKRENEIANSAFTFGLITGAGFGSVAGFGSGYATKAIHYKVTNLVSYADGKIQEAVSASTNLLETITPKIEENVAKIPEAASGLFSEAASMTTELVESITTFANESFPAVKPMISQVANSIGLENQPWVIGLLPASIIVGGIGSRVAAGATALIAKGSSGAFNVLGMKHLAEDFDNLGTTMGNFATRSPAAELKWSLKATVISAVAYTGYNSM